MNLDKLNSVVSGKTRIDGVSPFKELVLSKVYANPEQPRKSFNNLEEFAKEISQDGLLQPIVVVKRDDGYMIVSGERRYRAHQLLQAPTIKAHIIEVEDDLKVLELSLIENIQRDDLTAFETAVHIGKLWASGNYETKGALADTLGKSQTYISKAFSCLKLDDEIVKDLEVAKHDIGLSVLEELARVKDKVIQKEVYKQYLNKEITREGIAAHKNAESDEGFAKRMSKRKKQLICYGFGTQNDDGAFISICRGDIEGAIRVDVNGQRINHSNDINYKITIEEI